MINVINVHKSILFNIFNANLLRYNNFENDYMYYFTINSSIYFKKVYIWVHQLDPPYENPRLTNFICIMLKISYKSFIY